jgi:hypothetical protein
MWSRITTVVTPKPHRLISLMNMVGKERTMLSRIHVPAEYLHRCHHSASHRNGKIASFGQSSSVLVELNVRACRAVQPDLSITVSVAPVPLKGRASALELCRRVEFHDYDPKIHPRRAKDFVRAEISSRASLYAREIIARVTRSEHAKS